MMWRHLEGDTKTGTEQLFRMIIPLNGKLRKPKCANIAVKDDRRKVGLMIYDRVM